MGPSGNQPHDDEATRFTTGVRTWILSSREKQLLRRLAQGKSDKEIARPIGGTGGDLGCSDFSTGGMVSDEFILPHGL